MRSIMETAQVIAFCFDENDTQTPLALASVNQGNTSPKMVRLISSVWFVLERINRKLNRLLVRRDNILRQ